MEYVFGSVRRNGVEVETVKTVGEAHSDLSGAVSVTREYADSHITDNFTVVEKYRSENGTDDKCYDWYIISAHYRYVDRFTPGIAATEQEITEHDLSLIEAQQEITELDLRILELEAKEG